MNKKNSFFYIFIPILLMVAILALNTFANEQKIAEPPNEEWSHPISLLSTQKSTAPYLKVNEQEQVEAWIGGNDNLLERILVEDGQIVAQEKVETGGLKFDSSTRFQMVDDLLLVLNKNQLQVGLIDSNQIRALSFSINDVVGYDWIKGANENYLLVSTKNKLGIYLYQNKNFQLLGSYDGFPVSSFLKGIYNEKNIEIYTFSKPEYTIEYLKTTFSLENRDWKETKNLFSEARLESMFDVSNVNFIPHSEEIRIYMITKKRLKTEVKRQIEMVVFDRNNDQIKGKTMVVENPVVFGRESTNTEYLQYISSENEVDTFIVSALAGEGRENSNFKIEKLGIDKGQVVDYQFLSKGSTYSKYPFYMMSSNGDYVAWLDIMSNGYQLQLSSNSEPFKTVANEKMKGNWGLAFGYTFQDSWIIILSMLKGLIWLLGPLLLLIGFSIFNSELMDRKYRIIVLLSSILFVSIQMIDFGFFYKPHLVPFMPLWLTFTGSKLIIPLGIGLLIAYPTWAFMKKIGTPSPFLSFFYFVLIDLILVNLLFAPYMIF